MNFLRPMIAVLLAGCMAHCNDGCVPADRTAMEAAYSAETAACVKYAKSLEEIRHCREQVNTRYGLCPSTTQAIPCPDDTEVWVTPAYPPPPPLP